ncbi:MAG: hypothetical protein AB7U95_26430 [Reyranella sp.]
MLKLYYAPGACSTASHIGLEESGAKFDSQALAFAKSEQRTPEYLKINPRGRVPALVISTRARSWRTPRSSTSSQRDTHRT